MYQFRITDGYSHAEEFSADNQESFLREIVDAFLRFRAKKTGTMGLHLHAWAGDDWVSVQNRNAQPIAVSEKLAFADASGLWECAWRTAWGARHMNDQMGALRDFLRMTPEEAKQYRKSRFTVIDGGKR